MAAAPLANALDPRLWRDWTSIDGAAASAPVPLTGGYLQSWSGTAATMRQPALDHHVIVLHQGGAKRVHRSGGDRRRTVNVEHNAITTIEAGSIYKWQTEGPIAFAHIYVEPQRFAQLVAEVFDRDPSSVRCAEVIGRPDGHAANLFELMIASRGDPHWATIGDVYLDALIVRLAATAAWGGRFRSQARLSLAPHTIAKVRDFIHANLDAAVTLDDLAAVAGYSRYHFVRAFKEATGLPPYGYLLDQRIGAARELLQASALPIVEIARRTGFATHAHFSTRFRQTVGATPAEYRRRHRS